MNFKEDNNYLLVFIALILIGMLVAINIEDQIEDPEFYIRMRDE